MLTDYIAAAMRHARYELLPDGEGVYGEIPELAGVWANGDSVEETREDLRLALEGWLALAIARGIAIPDLDGVAISIGAVA
jgi:predicted RNase H-like HicB family nuclease